MSSAAHPFFVRPDVYHLCFPSKLFQESESSHLLFLGMFATLRFSTDELNADLRCLHSCLSAQKIAESSSIGYFVRRLGVLINELDAATQSRESLFNAFRRKARRFGTRDGFARKSGQPLTTLLRLYVALHCKRGQSLFPLGHTDLERFCQIIQSPG